MRALIALARFSLGLLLATLAAELALRAVGATPLWRILPVAEVALYGPDPDTGYRHRPGAHGVWLQENRSQVEINALGLRDRPRPAARTAAPRVVVLGNSLIEALQVDLAETAVMIAEQRLQADHPGAEVINLGMAGARPAVLVERLRTRGLPLKPDIAVLVIDAPMLLLDGNDSEYPAYRQQADGSYALSHGFRQTAGYRFRTSRAGDAFYWLLDHSAVAMVLNSRKNVGLLHEWPRAAAPTGNATDRCQRNELRSLTELLAPAGTTPEARRLSAFMNDLSHLATGNPLNIVLALRGLAPDCGINDSARLAIIDRLAQMSASAGIGFVDLDARLAERLPPADWPGLYGFGTHLGTGHFNQVGNRLHGELLAGIIASIPLLGGQKR